jgi:hypothetical protein
MRENRPSGRGRHSRAPAQRHTAEPSRFCEAIEKLLTPQKYFPIRQCCRGAEGIIKLVYRECGILPIVPDDDRSAIATRDVNTIRRADGGGKDVIADAIEPQGFPERFSCQRIEPGQNVLIVAQEIERVAVKERRRDVGSEAIESPRDIRCPGDIALRSGGLAAVIAADIVVIMAWIENRS